MGCSDIFCALCGGPLNHSEIWDSLRSTDPEPGGMYWDYNQELLCEEDTECKPLQVLGDLKIPPAVKVSARSLTQPQWLEDVRIVAEWQSKADKDKDIPIAAETYYSSEFDSCVGGLDATDKDGVTHWCYAFAKGENEGYYPGNHFVMHSACLLIVRRWMFEEGKSTQDLYNALSVYPTNDFTGVYLPNQHYGAQQFWEQFWIAKQGWEFLVKDAVNVPGMTEYILSKLQPVSLEEEKRLRTTTDRNNGAAPPPVRGPSLERLPVEVIQRICAYLTLTSTHSLGFSCRNLASRVTMDQAFYRKQLLSGHLFALTDLDLGLAQQRWDEIKDKDWRRLVRMLTRYENFYAGELAPGIVGPLHDAPIGLKNRMRIIKIVQGIFTGT